MPAEGVGPVGAAGRRARLRMALEQVREGIGAVMQPSLRPMELWLAGQPLPLGEDEREPVRFSVGLSCDLRRVTLYAEGEAATMAEPIRELLDGVGAGERELERVGLAGRALRPGSAGSWIESCVVGERTSLDGGWFFPGELPLEGALAQADASAAKERYAAWATMSGADTCLRLRRSVGAGAPFTEVVALVPDEHDAGGAATRALALFRALEVEGPPPSVRALIEAVPEGLAASAWLTARGVSRVGVLLPAPSSRTVLQLADAVGATAHTDTLARFEGALAVEGPLYAECCRTEHGFGVELHYVVDLPST